MCIAFTKSRGVRVASHHAGFIDSCLTISHICLPCLPSRWVNLYMFSTSPSHNGASSGSFAVFQGAEFHYRNWILDI